MSTNFTAVLPYVLPHVMGAPQPLAIQAINSAYVEFCQESLLVQGMATQDVVAGQQAYSIDIPSGYRLVKVLGVWHIDKWLDPVSIETVRSGLALRGAVDTAVPASSTPLQYFQLSAVDTAIQLYPIPADTVATGLLIRAAFRPNRTGATMDDEIFHDWVEVIAAGAIMRLLAMPTQPFYNAAAAATYESTFYDGCRAASIKARAGAVAASSSVRFSPFA